MADDVTVAGGLYASKSLTACRQTCYGMKEKCDMFQFGEIGWCSGKVWVCHDESETPTGTRSSTAGDCSLARIAEEVEQGIQQTWKRACIRGINFANLTSLSLSVLEEKTLCSR